MKKQNKIYLAIGIVAVLLIATIVIFSNQSKDEEVIKVGVMIPLTGFAQEHGQNVKQGIELAYNQLDEEQKGKIQLIFEDNQCDAKQALSAYNSLKLKGVDAIIGPVCSAVTIAVGPLSNQDKIPFISATSSSPDISNLGKYIYRVYPSDELDAILLTNFSEDFNNISIVSINNDYGQGVLNNVKNRISNKTVLEEKFDYGTQDFRSIITKIKYSKSDLIIFIAYPDNTISFLRQINELGLEKQIVGSSATFTSELFSNPSDKFYFTSPNVNYSLKSTFDEKYEEFYGSYPSYPAEYGFDNFLILSETLRKNGELKENLYSTSVNGATGRVGFNSKGDRIGLDIGLYKISPSGEFTCLKNCD